MIRAHTQQDRHNETYSPFTSAVGACRKSGGANTRPEMVVRTLVHGMGHQYRLQRRDLPGCPDLVLPIFVHGLWSATTSSRSDLP